MHWLGTFWVIPNHPAQELPNPRLGIARGGFIVLYQISEITLRGDYIVETVGRVWVNNEIDRCPLGRVTRDPYVILV